MNNFCFYNLQRPELKPCGVVFHPIWSLVPSWPYFVSLLSELSSSARHPLIGEDVPKALLNPVRTLWITVVY